MRREFHSVTTGQTIRGKVILAFACPFCKERKARVLVQCVDFDDGSTGVSHDLPECVEFNALEPGDYLRATRDRMRAHNKQAAS